MSKKNPRLERLISACGDSTESPCYACYFYCFNRGEYFDAHDVLESLWLREGKTGPDHAYYKGLIQGAGAFVHLKKQHEHPAHPVHSRRLEPAARLLALCLENLASYPDFYKSLDLNIARAMFQGYFKELMASRCLHNPWTPETAPQLKLGLVQTQS